VLLAVLVASEHLAAQKAYAHIRARMANARSLVPSRQNRSIPINFHELSVSSREHRGCELERVKTSFRNLLLRSLQLAFSDFLRI